MGKLNIIDWVVVALTLVGGINWGLVGLFGFDLVEFIFGSMTVVSRFVYIFVGLSALYMIALVPRFVHESSSI